MSNQILLFKNCLFIFISSPLRLFVCFVCDFAELALGCESNMDHVCCIFLRLFILYKSSRSQELTLNWHSRIFCTTRVTDATNNKRPACSSSKSEERGYLIWCDEEVFSVHVFCCHWTFDWRLIDVRLPQLYDLMVWEEDFSLFCVSLNAEVTRFTAAADLALFPLQSPFRPTELGSGVRNECRIDWISPSQRVSPNRRCVQITKYRRRERTPQLSLSLSLYLRRKEQEWECDDGLSTVHRSPIECFDGPTQERELRQTSCEWRPRRHPFTLQIPLYTSLCPTAQS